MAGRGGSETFQPFAVLAGLLEVLIPLQRGRGLREYETEFKDLDALLVLIPLQRGRGLRESKANRASIDEITS